ESRAEGLLEALAREDVRGLRILLPRAAGARPVLPETLVAWGARVDEVIAYQAITPPDADVDGLRAALAAGTISALTFTSSSTVRNFAELLGPAEIAKLGGSAGPVIACIGPITAETAREVGLPVHVCPQDYTAQGLAAALIDHFCNLPGDRLSRRVRCAATPLTGRGGSAAARPFAGWCAGPGSRPSSSCSRCSWSPAGASNSQSMPCPASPSSPSTARPRSAAGLQTPASPRCCSSAFRSAKTPPAAVPSIQTASSPGRSRQFATPPRACCSSPTSASASTPIMGTAA